MKKRKLIACLAGVLCLTVLTSCSSELENPFFDSESVVESVPEDVDRAKAQEVIDMINNLTSESTKEEVQAVFDAYNQLTERQKSFVTNFEVLEGYASDFEKKDEVARVIALIDELDEENVSADAVYEARSAYNALLEYGQEWQDKVPQEKVEKLVRCEIIVCNEVVAPLIEKAINIDITLSDGASHFVLLGQRIDDFLANVDQNIVSTLANINEYNSMKDEVAYTHSIAAADFYHTTIGHSSFLSLLDTEINDDFGYIHTADLSNETLSGSGNIQFATKHDFTAYKKLGFFIKWPAPLSRIQFLNAGATVHISEETVKNTFMYVEVSTAAFTDPTGYDYSHIGGYLENKASGCVSGYEITSIVGIEIDVRKAQAAVDRVNSLIEALDENNLSLDAVNEARVAYDSLASEYSLEWQAKVKEENVEKLERCETLVVTISINENLAKVNSMTLETKYDKAKFVLIGEEIEREFKVLTTEQKANVNGYDDYLSKKVLVNELTSILDSNGAHFLDGSTGAPITTNSAKSDVFGREYVARNLSLAGNSVQMRLNTNTTGHDWSNHVSFGYFARFDKPNGEWNYFIINGSWTNAPIAKGTLIDEATNLYFIEYSCSGLKPFTNNETFINMYFSNTQTSLVAVSDLVAFEADVSVINKYVAKAISVYEQNNNYSKAQFILLKEKISSLTSALPTNALNKISDYDKYLGYVNAVTSHEVMYTSVYTVSHGSNWPGMDEVESEEFGTLRTYDFGTTLSGGASGNPTNVFFNDARGKNWATKYSKIGVFIQLSHGPKDGGLTFVKRDNWSLKSQSLGELVDATNKIYYYEFDLATTDGAFPNNPFIAIYAEQISFINVTYLVGIIR